MNDVVPISRFAKFVHLLFLRPFVRLFSGVNISSREHLVGLDQYMIIANHNSHLDTMLLYYLLPIDHICRTHPVADKLHFSRNRFIFRIVNFLFKPIWVIRGQPDSEPGPLPQVRRALNQGHNVIIFPEGTRGAPGEMQHFKSGIGRLIVESPDIPVIPVLLTGPERALPRANTLLLPVWNNIIVGPPQRCHGRHREITGQLEQSIRELARSESARRHRRKVHEAKRVTQIAFVGIDGSGKSSTSRLTAQAMSQSKRVCLVSDQLEFYEKRQPATMQPLVTEKVRQRIVIRFRN
jgi:1-acyl-sn-glycerol-3-phosphate acyltransferase